MEIKKSAFVVSAPTVSKCPNDDKIEYAFIGRSNVGKSSLINMLCNHKGLAKTSATPGKTLLINHFIINDEWYLVDLPGYGYAEVPEQMRAHWQALLGRYLLTRAVLRGIVLLMDIRHPMKDLDIRMLECCAERQLPAHILLTKADKLSRGAAGKQLQAVRGELANWHAPFSVQMFSSLKKEGLPALVAQLDQWMAGDDDAC